MISYLVSEKKREEMRNQILNPDKKNHYNDVMVNIAYPRTLREKKLLLRFINSRNMRRNNISWIVIIFTSGIITKFINGIHNSNSKCNIWHWTFLSRNYWYHKNYSSWSYILLLVCGNKQFNNWNNMSFFIGFFKCIFIRGRKT